MQANDWFDFDSSIELAQYHTLAGVTFRRDLGRFKAGEKCQFVIIDENEVLVTKDGRDYIVEL